MKMNFGLCVTTIMKVIIDIKKASCQLFTKYKSIPRIKTKMEIKAAIEEIMDTNNQFFNNLSFFIYRIEFLSLI